MGLSAAWTALAGALGVMFGTVFMAFHGSQGPEMGLPQMIQSRAQFGYRGVALALARCSYSSASMWSTSRSSWAA